VYIQDHVIGRVLGSQKSLSPPLPVRLLKHSALLSRLPARLIGMGIRPEHVQTPNAFNL
jgi:hypothetical protein